MFRDSAALRIEPTRLTPDIYSSVFRCFTGIPCRLLQFKQRGGQKQTLDRGTPHASLGISFAARSFSGGAQCAIHFLFLGEAFSRDWPRARRLRRPVSES